MKLRSQLIRAAAALIVIAGLAAGATNLAPPAVEDCPFAKTSRPQRILLLDPIHKHPIWIDASIPSATARRARPMFA